MTIATCWGLAIAWYHDRLNPDFHRRTIDEALAIFNGPGLTGPFWSMDSNTTAP